jgi:hypothetical protein
VVEESGLSREIWDFDHVGSNPAHLTIRFLTARKEKTAIRKNMWVRVPQREKSPMAELVDAAVKIGNLKFLKDCYSKN